MLPQWIRATAQTDSTTHPITPWWKQAPPQSCSYCRVSHSRLSSRALAEHTRPHECLERECATGSVKCLLEDAGEESIQPKHGDIAELGGPGLPLRLLVFGGDHNQISGAGVAGWAWQRTLVRERSVNDLHYMRSLRTPRIWLGMHEHTPSSFDDLCHLLLLFFGQLNEEAVGRDMEHALEAACCTMGVATCASLNARSTGP